LTDLSGYAKKSTANGDTRSGLRLRLRIAVSGRVADAGEALCGRCLAEHPTGADRVYARIRAQLEHQGQPISGNDLLIAAQALALDLTIVTDNVGEFTRVDGLPVENWLRS
jgi:hypothetical protein